MKRIIKMATILFLILMPLAIILSLTMHQKARRLVGLRKLAIDGEGNTYVAFEDKIEKFDQGGNHLLSFGGKGKEKGEVNEIISMATDQEGNLYVAELGNHRIQKFGPQGESLLIFGKKGEGEGEFKDVFHVGISPQGIIYASDSLNHRIQRFSPEGEFLEAFGYWGEGEKEFKYPNGVYFDKEGNLYIADTNNRRVQILDKNDKFLKEVVLDTTDYRLRGSGLVWPGFILVTRDEEQDERYYISMFRSGYEEYCLFSFDKEGECLKSFFNEDEGIIQANSIALSPEGEIFVVDRENSSIGIFDQEGNLLRRFEPEGLDRRMDELYLKKKVYQRIESHCQAVVVIGLILGVAFLVVERRKKREVRVEREEEIAPTEWYLKFLFYGVTFILKALIGIASLSWLVSFLMNVVGFLSMVGEGEFSLSLFIHSLSFPNFVLLPLIFLILMDRTFLILVNRSEFMKRERGREQERIYEGLKDTIEKIIGPEEVVLRYTLAKNQHSGLFSWIRGDSARSFAGKSLLILTESRLL
ncbi:TPA: hypothetical protein DCX15_04285, partial [bacterium]|nr:hypothetical protein [bacterium]